MPRVTSIQRREARSNQLYATSANYDQTYDVDYVEVSPDGQNGIRLFFGKRGDKSLGIGLRIPRDVAIPLAHIVQAVESGSSKIKIDLK